MTEIKSASPVPPPTTPRASTTALDVALRLLQPMQGLLGAGESAQAEVVSVKETAQSFQLVLRLTLENGRQATVEAQSARPVPPGASYAVAALSDSRLLAQPQPGRNQPLQSIDLALLPAGSILQGKVIATGQQNGGDGRPTFQVVLSLLNSPLAGQKLQLETSTPLALGSLLTAQVQGSQALSFVPLSGLFDRLLLGQQLAAQHGRQAPMSGVFQALAALGNTLPDGLRDAAGKLLGLLPGVQQLSDPQGVARAFAASGAFLEAHLLSGHTAGVAGDLKAALLRLMAQLPNLPGSTPQAAAQLGAATGQALPAFARSALGALGQNNARQLALGFPLGGSPLGGKLPDGQDEQADLELLLKLAAAAVSRLQTHQLSSLAQTQTLPDGVQLTTWQLEVPMRDQRDIVPLQIKVQREQSQRQSDKEQPDTLWKIELAFDIQPLGPLQVQAQLLRGSLSSQLWAERGETAELIVGELEHLRERLQGAGINVGELACRQGVPPQGPRTSLDQRFVDETA